ncbi:MAG: hypothetical protein ACTTJC_02225 [Campylobacter sp.]
MRSNISNFEKDVSRITINAMNKTLKRTEQEQNIDIKKQVSVSSKYLKYATSSQSATLNDLSIEISVKNQKIRPERLKILKKEKSGTVVNLYDGKPFFFKGFGLQRNREKGGKFLISSKNIGKFDISEHGLTSRYKTKNGVKESKERRAYIAKYLPKSLDAFALKNSKKLLKKAQKIFAEELNR